MNEFEVVRRQPIALFDSENVFVHSAHALGNLVRLYGRFGHVGYDLAVLEFDDTVGVQFGEVAVVRYDKHEFFFRQFFKSVENLLAGLAVQRARRLVRHNHFGVLDERTRYRHTLILTARKFVGLAVAVARKIHFVEDFVKRLVCSLLALQLHGERDVRAYRELGQNVVLLKDKADESVAVTVEVRLREVIARLALNDEFAAVRAVQSAQYVQ